MDVDNKFWESALTPVNSSIGEAIKILDYASTKILLVVEDDGSLVGTVSDGDIRRGLIKGLKLDDLIGPVIHRNPFVVPPGLNRELVIQLMAANKIQQIPVISSEHRPIGLHIWEHLSAPIKRSNLVVIMAGGMGMRLRPKTESTPKPMLLVGDKPMLEIIINRFKAEGFENFVIAVHYLGYIIEDYFGNGSRFGVKIDYLREDAPLGTAGALSLLVDLPDHAFVVTNGDVLTDIRYGELIDFHVSHTADATMAVRKFEWQNPYGVVQTNGINIIGFHEKPVSVSYINAGIYVLNPDCLGMLLKNEYYDMPSLFEILQSKNKYTIAYPMHESWVDLGKLEDLELANKISASNSLAS